MSSELYVQLLVLLNGREVHKEWYEHRKMTVGGSKFMWENLKRLERTGSI